MIGADSRVQRLCRYITRPASWLERLSTNGAGQVVYALKSRHRDSTTHALFSGEEFIARLAAGRAALVEH